MRIDWWTLGLQTVNVLVLVWILSRYLFRPVSAMIEARRDTASKLLADAQQARTEASTLQGAAAEAARRTAEARAEALRSAASEAEAAKSEILAKARAQAEDIVAQGRVQLARAAADQQRQTAEKASLLAVDIARKLLTRLPSECLVMPFMPGLAEAAQELPASTSSGAGLLGPLQLRTARSLTTEEVRALREALEHALGHSIEFACAVDTDLIAGLELHGAHSVVRNSLRADLERITGELVADDRKG